MELISERPDLDLKALLQQRAYLAFSPNGDGIIHRAEQGKSKKGDRFEWHLLSAK